MFLDTILEISRGCFEPFDTRHHCVHRAGFDKDGAPIEVDMESISELLKESRSLVDGVEAILVEPRGIEPLTS